MFWKKTAFYLCVIPLSWIGTRWAIQLYWEWVGNIWPERSLALLTNRENTIYTMTSLGYGTQVRDHAVWAFNLQGDDIRLAGDEDPTRMWIKAYSKACILKQEDIDRRNR